MLQRVKAKSLITSLIELHLVMMELLKIIYRGSKRKLLILVVWLLMLLFCMLWLTWQMLSIKWKLKVMKLALKCTMVYHRITQAILIDLAYSLWQDIEKNWEWNLNWIKNKQETFLFVRSPSTYSSSSFSVFLCSISLLCSLLV